MTYATQAAIASASRIGLSIGLGDWREIFLAITDNICGETASLVSANLIGPVRDGAERWRIRTANVAFDVIYDPKPAQIVLVLRGRPDAESQPAELPRSRPPLRGKAAEMILADA